MYINTIQVRMQAILFDSLSFIPDFSPKAFAHNLQILDVISLYDLTFLQPLQFWRNVPHQANV